MPGHRVPHWDADGMAWKHSSNARTSLASAMGYAEENVKGASKMCLKLFFTGEDCWGHMHEVLHNTDAPRVFLKYESLSSQSLPIGGWNIAHSCPLAHRSQQHKKHSGFFYKHIHIEMYLCLWIYTIPPFLRLSRTNLRLVFICRELFPHGLISQNRQRSIYTHTHTHQGFFWGRGCLFLQTILLAEAWTVPCVWLPSTTWEFRTQQ